MFPVAAVSLVVVLRASLPTPLRGLFDVRNAAALLVSIVGATVVGLADVRGADYPAHLLRAELWDRAGPSVWNFHWYGGHATPTYSLVVPPLVALLGPFLVGATASVIASTTFARLISSRWRSGWATIAVMVFALSSTVNVVVGRIPFAVGLALALGAVAWWSGGHRWPAIALAALTPLASPVAGTFLGIAATARLIDAAPWRRWNRECSTALGVAFAAVLPIVVLSVAYRSEGWFPFRGDQALLCVLMTLLLAVLTDVRAIRIGALLAAATSVVVFAVPNPLGGNYLRLTQFVVIPLGLVAFGAAARSRPLAFKALAVGAVAWSLQVGVASALAWQGDASVHADYHHPLVDEVRHRNADGRPIGRLEVPFTENHWETYFVASEVPFARGWERQLDLERNAVLYDDDLTVETYRAWLDDNAVRWVAIPDVDLDEGGSPEAEVIRSGAADAWLQHVWSDENWVLYEVLGYQPIVDPPAVLVAERADSLVVSTPRRARVTVRYTAVDGVDIAPDGCVHDENGWLRLTLPEAGTYTVGVDVGTILPGDAETTCAD